MKAGTTSLYRDLAASPEVYFPADKEPGDLADPAVETPEGEAAYLRLFRGARPGQITGEASTIYTKAPDVSGVPDRARRVAGPGLRVIYVVREPVARVVSHFHHELVAGEIVADDLGDALDRYPRLLDYTRYAMQVRPWIETFGRDAVRIVRFEDYVRDRRATIADLTAFLGIADHSTSLDPSVVHNRSEGKPVTSPGWRRVTRARLYRTTARRLLPPRTRAALRRALLPAAPPPPEVTADLARRIRDELADDHAELAELLGITGPVWPDPAPAP